MELAALVRTVALVTGAVGAASVTWLVHTSWLTSVGALLIGAAAGYVVAEVVSRALYRTADGNTAVVKVGPGSLVFTIRAGVAGGVSTGVVVAVLALLLFGATSQAASLVAVSLACGVVVGVIVACLASLG